MMNHTSHCACRVSLAEAQAEIERLRGAGLQLAATSSVESVNLELMVQQLRVENERLLSERIKGKIAYPHKFTFYCAGCEAEVAQVEAVSDGPLLRVESYSTVPIYCADCAHPLTIIREAI